ncbi:CRISPR-associated endoribonuclease Cas2 [anaerobic digester metagenome]|jgi:CRISPR-associated protein Cas2|uniref:CRISPR-associated endoribonuclease Cas2 n=1 Tax=Methanobacterium subterraneum TaxID=59277 RepID=A0A2H4VNA7_9EURY|nr:CRISPR-associated endonuclease Cas2 [Methanobacterium subterraneum]AUB59578.1 CRISPR-associated endonuclease Cas2 [Methanobacterium subterraneum]
MYVIIVYDIKVERVNKVKGYLRTQLNWIQNSVFEGEVTPSELVDIKKNLKEIMNKNEDSIIIYTLRTEKAMKRDVMGIEKAPIDGIL